MISQNNLKRCAKYLRKLLIIIFLYNYRIMSSCIKFATSQNWTKKAKRRFFVEGLFPREKGFQLFSFLGFFNKANLVKRRSRAYICRLLRMKSKLSFRTTYVYQLYSCLSSSLFLLLKCWNYKKWCVNSVVFGGKSRIDKSTLNTAFRIGTNPFLVFALNRIAA